MFEFPPADRPSAKTTFGRLFFEEGVPASSFSSGQTGGCRLDLRTPV